MDAAVAGAKEPTAPAAGGSQSQPPPSSFFNKFNLTHELAAMCPPRRVRPAAKKVTAVLIFKGIVS